MKKPDYIDLSEFYYELKDSRIARYPLEERDASRLLFFRDSKIKDFIFKDIPSLLEKKDLLVFNETRVIHARLKFRKPTGAEIEIFCLHPADPPKYQSNFEARGSVVWDCLIGNAKKWSSDELRLENKDQMILRARKTGIKNQIQFSWEPSGLNFGEVLEVFGKTPIPPYLSREAEKSDRIRYQTVYSREEGSVAAPTAGLHFTDRVFHELSKKGISSCFLTLHVGAGTFIPVKSNNAAHHEMHTEHITITRENLECLIQKHDFIIPVGTTSCRTLESLYWLGVKRLQEGTLSHHLSQWEAYSLSGSYSRNQALEALCQELLVRDLDRYEASTSIMITPGYEFKMTDALLTNFHQPSSTLLMLIAALTGGEWRKIYDHALANDYRFLSYGDSSLLYRGGGGIRNS